MFLLLIFFGLSILSAFLFLLFWGWRNREYIRLYVKLGSCYNTIPIVEHLLRAIGDKERLMNIVKNISDHAMANGGLSSYWVLQKLYIVIVDAEDADVILKQHLEKDKLLFTFAKLFHKDNLICAPVPVWRRHRKAIAPIFLHNNVLKFWPIFAKGSCVMVKKLRPMVGTEFCIHDCCNALTFDSACKSVLGLDVNSQDDPNEPFRTAINFMKNILSNSIMIIASQVKFIRRRMPWYSAASRHRKIIHQYVNEAVTQNPSKETNKDIFFRDEVTNLRSLSMRLDGHDKLEFSELQEDALFLLLAATDTTSTTLSFVILLLSWYPEVQDKVYQEMNEVFVESDWLATVKDLSRLRYLDAVIKECLRLYPPGPVLIRQAVSEVTLPSGLKFSKGTNFCISVWGLNRNPKYWGADAELFRPERFMENHPTQLNAFLSFSTGPRSCPGGQLATLFMKTALTAFLRQYRVLPAQDDAAASRCPRLLTNGILGADQYRIRLELRTSS